MSKREEVFKLFNGGKNPQSPEVIALGLKGHTRYNYYREWKKLKDMQPTVGDPPVEENEEAGESKPNLSTIDLQEEREKALSELKELRKVHQDELSALGQGNQELRERLFHTELEIQRLYFESRLDVLSKSIEAGVKRASFSEQLTEIRQLAEELGYRQQPTFDFDNLANLIGQTLSRYLKEK